MVISAPVSSWIEFDHLALRADDLADLVYRDMDRDDPRRVGRHLAGLG